MLTLSQEGSTSHVNVPNIDPSIRNAEYVNSAIASHAVHDLDINAAPFVPTYNAHQSHVTDFTQYLLKNDLLLCRLANFDDKAEHYIVWKTNFKSIVKELSVSMYEELDLIVKYLGPESAKYAINIRAANIANPELSLHRIWERLEDRYGCPELVDDCLKKKLKAFPNLTNRDGKKLFELADIVSEIQGLKENLNYNMLLSYHDTSVGINPIVSKLPHNLKEKWVTHAANYKRKHHVPFPPFHVFDEFLRDLARVRNDPGLQFDNDNSIGANRTPAYRLPTRNDVTTRKTEVNKAVDKCPIHRTIHSLRECRETVKREQFMF